MPKSNDVTKTIIAYKDEHQYSFPISVSTENDNRCHYEHRSGPLHNSLKIGGTVKLGRCCNDALPGMLFCYVHATRDAMSLVIRNLNAELETFKTKKGRKKNEQKK